MQDDAALRQYFQALAEHGRALVGRLPIPPETQPIARTFATLQPAIAAARADCVRALQALPRPAPLARGADDPPIGMNGIGVLADRLTILICKEFYVRTRYRRPAQADAIHREQIADIVACLALARPGHASLLEKVSPIAVAAAFDSFVAAYYDLLGANLLMWETQELLYTRDMEAVPAEELRDYIRFFSQANMLRNRCIAESERLYWAGA
jgi:hypothetical protein